MSVPVSSTSAPGDAHTPAGAPSPVSTEGQRRADLARMKWRATGLLGAITVAFTVIAVVGGEDGWQGYLRAAAEAGMVGGLADWFAVTALFRHPLGLPIPHTAVIAERKHSFGATLGSFVQENFLSAPVVGDRLRAATPARRLGAWLADDANAAVAADHLAGVVAEAVAAVDDDEVGRMVGERISERAQAVPVAPIAGRLLATMTADGRHTELVEAAFAGLERFLDDHEATFRQRFDQQSPAWVPRAIDDRIFRRLFDGARDALADERRDEDHELRDAIDAWLADFADRLEHDPALAARASELVRDLTGHPEVRRWSSEVWGDVKASLQDQAAADDSDLHRYLRQGLTSLGQRLLTDDALAARLDELAVTGVTYAADNFSGEIAGLVSGTIDRWDPAETSDRLELLLGRDLQWIRINGTVVGALAGTVIHAVGGLIG